MISTADFRNGSTIILDGDLLQIVEFQHVKPGKGGAFVRTKFKNILTGRTLERTFRSGEKFDEARIEGQVWQYLYHDGDFFHFMHKETFEQFEVGEKIVGDKAQWMKEQTDVTLMFYDGRVIMVEVPFFVVLRIAQCDPGVQGDRATGGTKPAVLETGATVQVPLFVQEGEVIRVDTRTSQYIERAN
jgi:elongation factor P